MASADNNESWCLIESDPGIFTELIVQFGCTGVEVEELWSLEIDNFEYLKPVHGLIFLFKWMPNLKSDGFIESDQNLLKEIFFAKQMITNACATQAVLSILLNCNHPDVNIGPMLQEFKTSCNDLDPNMKGLALANCENIRNVHNSFAKPCIYTTDEERERKEQDLYHFIAYVPINGRIYEIDGLKPGPIQLANIENGEDWLESVRPFIFKKIEKYQEGEIHFNLLAVITELKMKYERNLNDLEKCFKKVGGKYNEGLLDDIRKLQILIKEQELKRKRYADDNVRRSHNYLPLIIELLKIVAKQGLLINLYEKAKAVKDKLINSICQMRLQDRDRDNVEKYVLKQNFKNRK